MMKTYVVMMVLALLACTSTLGSSKTLWNKVEVVTMSSPPFVRHAPHMKKTSGFAVDLLKSMGVADQIEYVHVSTFFEFDAALRSGDTANNRIGFISGSGKNAVAGESSLPIFEGGFQIFTRFEQRSSYWKIGKDLRNEIVFGAVGFVLLIFVLACVAWVAEALATINGGVQFFHPEPLKGLLESATWVAQCCANSERKSTPRSHITQIIESALRMFAKVFFAAIVAYWTAALVSTAGSAASGSSISEVNDLAGHSVGCVDGSAAHEWLTRFGIATTIKTYPSWDKMMRAFDAAESDVDCLVEDFTHLRSYESRGVIVGPVFGYHFVGFVLPAAERETRHEFNAALVVARNSATYDSIVKAYFGKRIMRAGIDVGDVNEDSSGRMKVLKCLMFVALSLALLIVGVFASCRFGSYMPSFVQKLSTKARKEAGKMSNQYPEGQGRVGMGIGPSMKYAAKNGTGNEISNADIARLQLVLLKVVRGEHSRKNRFSNQFMSDENFDQMMSREADRIADVIHKSFVQPETHVAGNV